MYEKAVKFAEEALKGMVNLDKTPYLEHALRVADQMETEEEKTVAVLHDVLEDTEKQTYDLVEAGFPREVVETVDQLCRKNNMTYFEYIEDIATNRTAAKIKLAEIADNQDIFRVNKLSFQTYSVEERCAKVEKILKAMLYD